MSKGLLSSARGWLRRRRRGDADPSETWKSLMQSRRVRLKPQLLIDTDAHPRIFCLGSCFALEIKKALKTMDFRVSPWDYDLELELPNGGTFISNGEHMVLYTTFTMRQEFEKAFGLWQQSADDYWEAKTTDRGGSMFRDPYRRSVVHPSLEGVIKITNVLDELLREGIRGSDVYILTLGLTEAWQKLDDGRYANQYIPGFDESISFCQSGYEQNYANLKAIADLVFARFPDRKIVLTVSPVPLKRTFSQEDVSVANTESKAILRAVAGSVAREYANVYYFPSFEMCALAEKFGTETVFREDGRHVRPEMVQTIVQSFLQHHVAPGSINTSGAGTAPTGPLVR
jgi:hypothetical protein